MNERHFTYLGHEIVTQHPSVNERVGDGFETTLRCDTASIPLTIANAFDFMIENGVRTLVVDGQEIRRTR